MGFGGANLFTKLDWSQSITGIGIKLWNLGSFSVVSEAEEEIMSSVMEFSVLASNESDGSNESSLFSPSFLLGFAWIVARET